MSEQVAEGVRPFANGFEYHCWTARNCDRCVKQYVEAARAWRCDIQRAIDVDGFLEGVVPAEIGRRMGYDEERFARDGWPLAWPCPEFEAAPPPRAADHPWRCYLEPGHSVVKPCCDLLQSEHPSVETWVRHEAPPRAAREGG